MEDVFHVIMCFFIALQPFSLMDVLHYGLNLVVSFTFVNIAQLKHKQVLKLAWRCNDIYLTLSTDSST